MQDVIHLDESHRLGLLWRSQGEAFLEEQAAALIADVDRLRAAYLAGLAADMAAAARPSGARRARPFRIIDLRDADVSAMACARPGHGDVPAAARCVRCADAYCGRCIVRPEATDGDPLCTECALIVGGIHRTRSRPLVAPGRAGRSTSR